MRILALALFLATAIPAWATPFFVDGTAGNDANNGLGRANDANPANRPWKSWSTMLTKIRVGTVTGGDTILIRPGRYLAAQTDETNYGTALGDTAIRVTVGGGTSLAVPLTITVDTAYPGDVEVDGAYAPDSASWHQAYSCSVSSGSLAGTPCDSTNGVPLPLRCGAGSCDALTGVFWATTGVGGFHMTGMAFQPSPVPGGTICAANSDCGGSGYCEFSAGLNRCTPKLYEILYSPEAVPITIPTFTAGRAQTWIYKEYSPVCHGAGNPWACCTGVGQGTFCQPQSRVYAQTAAGTNPSLASPRVMLPADGVLQYRRNCSSSVDCGGSACVLENSVRVCSGVGPKFITFTNNDNGRLFHFFWGTDAVLFMSEAEGMVFKNYDVAYNSKAIANGWSASVNPWIDSGSAFPRRNNGPMYLIQQAPGATSGNTCASPPTVKNITWRKGFVHGPAGDEGWHIDCGDFVAIGDTTRGTLIEDNEVWDQPLMLANGSTPNADVKHTASELYGYAVSWPPPGYRAGWAAQYSRFMSPLGGGGETAGYYIIGHAGNTIRHNNFHDGLCAQLETLAATGNLVENNKYDFTFYKYTGDPFNTLGISTPTFPIAGCLNGPDGTCSGFLHKSAFSFPGGTTIAGQQGNVVRNNAINNCYLSCFIANSTGASFGTLCPTVVNNTIRVKAGALFTTPAENGEQVGLRNFYGTAACHGIFKENIVERDSPQGTLMAVETGAIATTDIDGNLYNTNVRFQWGANAATNTFATFQTQAQVTQASNEVHGLSTSNVQFASAIDSHILASSPARDTVTCLLATDLDGKTRPLGVQCDMGAYEFDSGAPPTTTSTSTSSSTLFTTSTSTSTSTSTTTSSTVLGNTSSTSTSTSTSSSTSTTSTTLIGGLYRILKGIKLHGPKVK